MESKSCLAENYSCPYIIYQTIDTYINLYLENLVLFIKLNMLYTFY